MLCVSGKVLRRPVEIATHSGRSLVSVILRTNKINNQRAHRENNADVIEFACGDSSTAG